MANHPHKHAMPWKGQKVRGPQPAVPVKATGNAWLGLSCGVPRPQPSSSGCRGQHRKYLKTRVMFVSLNNLSGRRQQNKMFQNQLEQTWQRRYAWHVITTGSSSCAHNRLTSTFAYLAGLVLLQSFTENKQKPEERVQNL